MRSSAKGLHSRRLIEYVLAGCALVLLLFALWVHYYIRKNTAPPVFPETTVQSDVQLQGTLNEIDQLTEQEILQENDTLKQAHAEALTSNNSYDGAADNVGGIYDESTY